MKQAIDAWLSELFLPIVPKTLHPNHVTIFRVFLIPVVLLLCVGEYWLLAFVLYVFTALTDYVDGWLARARNQTSEWGKRADEQADKLLFFVFTSYFWYIEIITTGSVLFLLALLMIVREVIITAARHFEQIKYRGVLLTARLKTTLQMIAIGCLLLSEVWEAFWSVGAVVFLFATWCSIYSAYYYIVGMPKQSPG